jgi:membrane-associated protein
MDFLRHLLDLALHLDRTLRDVTQQHGTSTYAILAGIVFCETGLVVTPFLPGDSLLFAAGAVAALGSLSPTALIGALFLAVVCGDNANYWVGHLLGRRLLAAHEGRLIKREHLERTHSFYERYGPKTIVLARFVPIIRTLAPFVAGLGSMRYRRFMAYSVAGGLLWVVVGILAGYFFGTVPIVQKNFSLVILAIIALSLVPAAVEVIRARRAPARPSSGTTSPPPSREAT